MMVSRGSRRGRRFIAGLLVAAMLAGAIVTDRVGIGNRSGRYAGSPALSLIHI